MKNFWYNLSRREQILLMLCGSLILFFILYIVVLKPLSDRKENSFRTLKDEKGRYERVLQMAANMPNNFYQDKHDLKSTTPIRTAATEASKEIGVSIARIQPGPNDTLSFWIDAVKTEELFNWLMLLDKRYGNKVQKVSIQKNTGENTLRGQFEFKSGLE